jgi:hypothetical protein
MRINNTQIKILLGATGLALLSACTSVSTVKDVTADRDGHMHKNFSPQALNPVVAKKLAVAGKSSGFGKMTVTREAESTQNDGKKTTWKSVETFTDAGHGLVERLDEFSSNDIPTSLHYTLSYKGAFDLRWQIVPLQAMRTTPIYEVKNITRFERLPTAVGQESVIDFQTGAQAQVANFLTEQRKCKAAHTMVASDINQKLSGQAIELDCETSLNNSIQNRTKMMFLEQYGVAILTEVSSSTNKVVYRITDVSL